METCCSAEETSQIVLWFQQFRATNWSLGCTKKLLTMKCASCSPNQKSFINRIFENNLKLWELTLCWDFCASLYQSCRDEPVLGVSVGSLWILPQDFCAALSTPALTFRVAPKETSSIAGSLGSITSRLAGTNCFSGRRAKASEHSYVIQDVIGEAIFERPQRDIFGDILEEEEEEGGEEPGELDGEGGPSIEDQEGEGEDGGQTEDENKGRGSSTNREKIKRARDFPGEGSKVGSTEGGRKRKARGQKPSGLVGEELSFRIQAVDWQFVPINYGGDTFHLIIEGPDQVEYQIVDELTGQYRVEYVVQQAGRYQFNILTDDRKPIINSPLFVYIAPVSLCPLQTEEFSLSRKTSGDSLCWWYSNNGCCDEYSEYEIEVWLEREVYPIFGRDSQCSSMIQLLYCGYLCSPQQAFIVHYSPIDKKTTFSVCENFCKALYHSCQHHRFLTLSVKSIFQAPNDLCFSFQSFFGSSIQVIAAGEKLTCFNGSGVSSPEFTYAYGPGLGPTISVGTVYHVSIQALGWDGNLQSIGGDKVRIEIYGPGKVDSSPINDLNNGLYEFFYSLVKTGKYLIHIYINNQELLNSPYQIIAVCGELDAGRSTLGHDQLFVGAAGVESTFMIHTRDRFDNIYHTGGRDISAHISGPEHLTALIKDNLDGTYTVKFTPTKSGGYVLLAYVDNVPVVGSPFIFHIYPGDVSPHHSIAYGQGLEMEAVQSSIGEFTIQTRDRFGNNRETSVLPSASSLASSEQQQESNFVVSVDHSNPKTQSKVIDNFDGTFSVRYSREELGLQLISVTIDGAAIIGSPFIIFVQPESGVPRETEDAQPGESEERWWP